MSANDAGNVDQELCHAVTALANALANAAPEAVATEAQLCNALHSSGRLRNVLRNQLCTAVHSSPSPEALRQQLSNALDSSELVTVVTSWQSAMDASYNHGYADGERAGRWAEEREDAQRWHQTYLQVRSTMAMTRLDELARLRLPTNEPCAVSCGRCSRCIHADAVARRGGREYTGGPVAWNAAKEAA